MIALCTYTVVSQAQMLKSFDYYVGWHEIHPRPALFRFSLVGQDGVGG